MPEAETTATVDAPAASEPSYASVLEASFNKAREAVPDAPEPNVEGEPRPIEHAPPPAQTKSAVQQTEVKAAAADAEFPAELMGGEKAPESVAKDPLEEIQLHGNVKEQTRKSFDDLKAIARTERESAAKLKAELEALKSTKVEPVADPEELKSARQKLAEMEETLTRESVRATPGFQKLVSDEQYNLKTAKGYLEGIEIDGVAINPEVIDLASHLTGSKRTAALRNAGLDAETIASVAPHLAKVDDLRLQQADAVEHSKEIQGRWLEQQRAADEAAEAERTVSEKRAFDDALAELEGQYEFLKIYPGHDKYNAQIAAIKTKSEEMFLTPKPAKEQASIVAKGVAFDLVHRMLNATREELKATKATVAKLTAAQPNGGSTASNGTGLTIGSATTPEQLRQEREQMFEQGIGR